MSDISSQLTDLGMPLGFVFNIQQKEHILSNWGYCVRINGLNKHSILLNYRQQSLPYQFLVIRNKILFCIFCHLKFEPFQLLIFYRGQAYKDNLELKE